MKNVTSQLRHSYVTGLPYRTVPNRTVPNHTEEEKGKEEAEPGSEESSIPSPPGDSDKSKSWEAPEWFVPLTRLKGYRQVNHSKGAQMIAAACAEAGVDPGDVVGLFSEQYPTLKHQYGWTDPVAVLRRGPPLGIAIKQLLNGAGSPNGKPGDDMKREAAELERSQA